MIVVSCRLRLWALKLQGSGRGYQRWHQRFLNKIPTQIWVRRHFQTHLPSKEVQFHFVRLQCKTAASCVPTARIFACFQRNLYLCKHGLRQPGCLKEHFRKSFLPRAITPVTAPRCVTDILDFFCAHFSASAHLTSFFKWLLFSLIWIH